MLAVEQHLAAPGLGGAHALANTGKIILERGLQRHTDMIVPGLRHEADGVGAGVEQHREAGIVGSGAARPPRHAEGREGRP